MMRVDQAGHRLISGQRRGRGDRQQDRDPRQILRPPIPMGITAGGRTAAQHERHPERDGGQRIRRVMQRVTQEGHRPRQSGHHRLDQRGQAQHSQRDPQRPHTLGAVLHHRIDLCGRLMRMRSQHMPQPGHRSRAAALMAMLMFVIMAIVVLMAGVMASGVQVAHKAQDARETLLQHLSHSGLGAPASRSLFPLPLGPSSSTDGIWFAKPYGWLTDGPMVVVDRAERLVPRTLPYFAASWRHAGDLDMTTARRLRGPAGAWHPVDNHGARLPRMVKPAFAWKTRVSASAWLFRGNIQTYTRLAAPAGKLMADGGH